MTPNEQLEILRFLAPRVGGLTFACDVAMACDFPPRAAGAKLRALARRGLVVRRVVVHHPRLYGWELTEAGQKACERGAA